jgi:hypothetical protein|tara:strand:+ start:64 stop:762 length:699 start_codon:yes stop_codon:yes gene_type:complete
MNNLKLLNTTLENLKNKLISLQKNNISIILTCCVNVNFNIGCLYQTDKHERINIYVKAINKWIDETTLNIIVVESSGYSFPELQSKVNNRFQIITFDANNNTECNQLLFKKAKGQWEVFAIQYAYKNSEILQRSKFIIKITGRYYIPTFEKYLIENNIIMYDCLRQSDPNYCEFLGCRRELFNEIFNIFIEDGHIENVFKNRIEKYNNVLICNKFEIEPTQQGGLNIIRTFL